MLAYTANSSRIYPQILRKTLNFLLVLLVLTMAATVVGLMILKPIITYQELLWHFEATGAKSGGLALLGTIVVNGGAMLMVISAAMSGLAIFYSMASLTNFVTAEFLYSLNGEHKEQNTLKARGGIVMSSLSLLGSLCSIIGLILFL